MKSNKGFSLVELVIVIAIMAILVGLFAPNLLRLVEKTRVSQDVQLADSIKKAVELAMSDPDVVEADSYVRPVSGEMGKCIDDAGEVFRDAVYETLGVEGYAAVLTQFQSKDCSAVTLEVDSVNSRVTVKVDGSHADAMGGETPIIVK